MHWTTTRTLIFGLCTSLLVGCGVYDFGSGPASEFGATPGGVKDLNSARELIENGQVPPPEALSVEALFSEHDLPLSGPPCPRLLCLRGALGVAPTLDGQLAGWVQVGMSSTVDPERFSRPSLALVLTVDVSNSMGWGYKGEQREYPTPGRLAHLLLREIAARLLPADRVALVTYGSTVDTVIEDVAGDDPAILRAIESLDTNGSTNMEAGLLRAYEVARRMKRGAAQARVILFSDEQPNVGATHATEFSQIVEGGAHDGIGATILGLGLGLRQELMVAMSKLRGGNAFSLTKESDVASLMEDSWPWMVSPIAYDLALRLTPSGSQVAKTYGFPGQDPKDASLAVSTVFLSRRRGALLVELTPAQAGMPAGLSAQGALSYLTLDGQPQREDLAVRYGGQPLDGRMQYFEQPSVSRAVALAVMMAAAREAAERYGSDRAGATALMEKAAARIQQDAAAFPGGELDREVRLATDLLSLMRSGAPQGGLYGRR